MLKGDYYEFYFENILCVCDLPRYYPKSTLNNDKVGKNINIVLVTIFDKFQNLPKIFITRMLKGDYYEFYFENILCVCDLPRYYPKSTLNNDKVGKNINIVLVTIFDKFQNLPKALY